MSSAPEKKQKRLHLMSLISSLGCCHSLPDFLFPIFIFIFLSVIARFKEKLHLAGTFYFIEYVVVFLYISLVFLLVRLRVDHVKIFNASFAAHSFQILSCLQASPAELFGRLKYIGYRILLVNQLEMYKCVFCRALFPNLIVFVTYKSLQPSFSADWRTLVTGFCYWTT